MKKEKREVQETSENLTFDLYSECDERGTRQVWLRLTGENALILHGQDLGDGVREIFGYEEYEWVWELSASRLPLLLDSLGLSEQAKAVGEMAAKSDPDNRREMLAYMGSVLGGIDKTQLQGHFQRAGAKFWNRIGN